MSSCTPQQLLESLQNQVSNDAALDSDYSNTLKHILLTNGGGNSTIATAALECAALIAVKQGDLDAFQRHVSLVKAIYENAESDKRAWIMGLNLMYLLLMDNPSEFHSELEMLYDNENLLQTSYIQFPVLLEQRLMLGSYNDVAALQSQLPDPSYGIFMESLLVTVRDRIADCLESAYRTLSLEAARKMLGFATIQELEEYRVDDWVVENGELCFQPPSVGRKATDVPSMKLIAQTLSYATELERIV